MLQQVTGEGGSLHCRWQEAARLGSWRIIRGEDKGFHLIATVIDSNFWLTQQPLTFIGLRGTRWPVLSLEISGAQVNAVLGPPEVPHGPAGSPTGRHALTTQ